MRKTITVGVLTAAFAFGAAAPAFALDCVNNSRPPADTSGTPVDVGGGTLLYTTVGNWAYIYTPSEGRYEWTFVPPGTIPGVPGAQGNYQAGSGYGLLDNSAATCVGRVNQPGMHGVTADPGSTSTAQPCR